MVVWQAGARRCSHWFPLCSVRVCLAPSEWIWARPVTYDLTIYLQIIRVESYCEFRKILFKKSLVSLCSLYMVVMVKCQYSNLSSCKVAQVQFFKIFFQTCGGVAEQTTFIFLECPLSCVFEEVLRCTVHFRYIIQTFNFNQWVKKIYIFIWVICSSVVFQVFFFPDMLWCSQTNHFYSTRMASLLCYWSAQ